MKTNAQEAAMPTINEILRGIAENEISIHDAEALIEKHFRAQESGLREMFACAALEATLAAEINRGIRNSDSPDMNKVAAECWYIADKLMEGRK